MNLPGGPLSRGQKAALVVLLVLLVVLGLSITRLLTSYFDRT